MRILFTLLCLFFLASPVLAGPFGTEMADPVEKYRNARFLGSKYGIDNFSTSTLPQQKAPFIGYQLCFFERQLIGVAAFSQEGSTVATKQLFQDLYSCLARQYGQETLKLKRFVQWVASDVAPLPDNLSSIKLVYGEQNGNFSVHVYFDYRNAERLKNKIRADKQQQLEKMKRALEHRP